MFAAALVLMTNILGLKRSGKAVNMEKDLALVGKSIEMLRSLRYECVCIHNKRQFNANTERSDAASKNAHLGNTGVCTFVISIHDTSHVLRSAPSDVLTSLMSGASDSLAPGASASGQEGGRENSQSERERAPPCEQRTEGPNPAAHPVQMHPDLDFTLPSTLTTLFRSDVFEQGLSTPVDGPIPRDATEDELPPPAVSHVNLSSIPPVQFGDLPLPPPPGAAPVYTAEGAEQGPPSIDTGRMFGLDAIGTPGSISWLPPAIQQTGPQHHPQDPNHGHLGTGDTLLGEQDSGMPSDLFMLMDDTLALWPSASPIFG